MYNSGETILLHNMLQYNQHNDIHTFDINFPPEMVPVGLLLPHFFFFSSSVSISVLLSFSVLTHPILYISFPYDTSVLIHFIKCLTSLLLSLSLNFFLPFFLSQFLFPLSSFLSSWAVRTSDPVL